MTSPREETAWRKIYEFYGEHAPFLDKKEQVKKEKKPCKSWTLTMISKLTILELSDVHLGHRPLPLSTS